MTARRDRTPRPRAAPDRTRAEVAELAGLLREASDLAERLRYPDLAQALWRDRGMLEREAATLTQNEMFAPDDIRPPPPPAEPLNSAAFR